MSEQRGVAVPGLGLRDWFAAQAMSAHVAHGGPPRNETEFQDLAAWAYRMANTMVVFRNALEAKEEAARAAAASTPEAKAAEQAAERAAAESSAAALRGAIAKK